MDANDTATDSEISLYFRVKQVYFLGGRRGSCANVCLFKDGEPNHGGVGPEHASDTLLGDGPR